MASRPHGLTEPFIDGNKCNIEISYFQYFAYRNQQWYAVLECGMGPSIYLPITINMTSTFSVRALLYSTRHLYMPSSVFRTSSILSKGGEPVASKYALVLTFGDGKCLAPEMLVSLTSRLYTGLPESSLCHKTSVTSSSVVVTLRSQGSSTRPPSSTE